MLTEISLCVMPVYNSFRFTAKLNRKYKELPYPLPPPTHTQSLLYYQHIISWWLVYLLQLMSLISALLSPKFIFVPAGMMESVGLDIFVDICPSL